MTREDLYRAHAHLAGVTANFYRKRALANGIALEDLEAQVRLELWRLTGTWKSDMGATFATFAYMSLRRAALNYLNLVQNYDFSELADPKNRYTRKRTAIEFKPDRHDTHVDAGYNALEAHQVAEMARQVVPLMEPGKRSTEAFLMLLNGAQPKDIIQRFNCDKQCVTNWWNRGVKLMQRHIKVSV